jgi:predicted nucleotidyltransferase component of viral defense system
MGDRFGDQLLLKGGTCLMKVDVGFRRMSEDVDLVIPWNGALRHKGSNASHTNRVRDALRELGPIVGIQLETPDGQAWEKRSHITWTVHYPSEFGRVYPGRSEPTATIDVEVAMRPVLLPARSVRLQTALSEKVLGDYSNAHCFALAFAEVRGEKVRAAFTREEPQIRDYFDLGLLLECGADMVSNDFIDLVSRKLAEVGEPDLAHQPARVGLVGARLSSLETGRANGLEAVVRQEEAPFDLEELISAYDAKWSDVRQS